MLHKSSLIRDLKKPPARQHGKEAICGRVGPLHSCASWSAEPLTVCVARTSCKAQLENIPRSVCVVRGLPATPTLLSGGHVLRVVFTVVIVAHVQLSTPSSLVLLLTTVTHLLSSWTRQRCQVL